MSDLLKGGPAFPTMWKPYGEAPEPDHPGMSLRDYFAAKAMQALLRHDAMHGYELGWIPPEQLAKGAYCYADAMLKEREK